MIELSAPTRSSGERIARFCMVMIVGTLAMSGCIESESQKIPDDAIVVGLLLPYTGGDAATGTNYERGALIARDMINDAGGIKEKPLHFISRDTHSDPARAKESLRELLSYDVKAVIGPEGAEIARAILPTLQKEKVLFISPVVSGAKTLPVTKENPWIRLAPSSSTFGHAFANHLFYKEGLRTLSTVYSEDDYNNDFVESLEVRFIELGGGIESSLVLSAKKLSFADEVLYLRQGETDNIVLSASIDSSARFVNELSISDKKGKWNWYLSPGLQTPVFLENTIVSALEGAIGVGIQVANPKEAFIEMYTDRWSDTPLDGAFFYFDAVTVLSLAMNSASHNNKGKISYASMIEAVSSVATPSGVQVLWEQQLEGFRYIEEGRNLYYSGLTGPLLFTEDGQQRKTSMSTWSIVNGVIESNEAL